MKLPPAAFAAVAYSSLFSLAYSQTSQPLGGPPFSNQNEDATLPDRTNDPQPSPSESGSAVTELPSSTPSPETIDATRTQTNDRASSASIPSVQASSGGGNRAGPIVGGVIGGAIILLLAIGAFFYLRRRRFHSTRGDDLGVLEKSQALSPTNSSPAFYSSSPPPPTLPQPQLQQTSPPTLPQPQLQQAPPPPPAAPPQQGAYDPAQSQISEGKHLVPSYGESQPQQIPQRNGTVSTVISSVGGLGDPRDTDLNDDGVSIRSPSPGPTPSPERQQEREVPRLPLYERASDERAL